MYINVYQCLYAEIQHEVRGHSIWKWRVNY